VKLNVSGWQRTCKRGRSLPLPPLIFGVLAILVSEASDRAGACDGWAMPDDGGLAPRG
jgi:hypothetical protein